MKTVFVFGTFDGLHPGHEAFLRDARALGDALTVSIAQDEIVVRLKHRPPLQTLAVRLRQIEQSPYVTKVIPGDLEIGTYHGFKAEKPNIVAFGYDQTELLKDFTRFQTAVGDETEVVVLKPFHPETYKSSLLRGQANV
ncbi:MAG TPA: adenylyltransferase/cytidyltransferase family protein [bacterium]|nr:adenylyltransferase/cytidyltransferase family protein [bacterium]